MMKISMMLFMLFSLGLQAAPIDELLLDFVSDDQDFLFNRRGMLSDRKVNIQNSTKPDIHKLIKKYKTTKNKDIKNSLWRGVLTEAAIPDNKSTLIIFLENYNNDFPLLEDDVLSGVARIAGLHAYDLYSQGKLKAAIGFLKGIYVQDPRFANEIGFVKNYSILSYMNGDLKSSIEIVEKFNASSLELNDSIQTILVKAKQAQRKARLQKNNLRLRY